MSMCSKLQTNPLLWLYCCGAYVLVAIVAVRDTLYIWFWQEAMLSEGQTDGVGSKQKQRKKDSHTMVTRYILFICMRN